MATANPFGLLGDDDAEDPSQLIAAQKAAAAAASAAAATTKKAAPLAKPSAQSGKLPSKPLPPAQAVREAKGEGGRGGRGYGRGGGGGRGRGGYSRDFSNNENSRGPAVLGNPEDGEAGRSSERRPYLGTGGGGGPRGGYRGGRRGGYANGADSGDGERPPRRAYERHSGTGRGNEFKREGAGRGNWGTQTDELAQVTEDAATEGEKVLGDERPAGEEEAADANKENQDKQAEEKEPEDKEMTLEEYEKVLEEKRKALLALKTEERKVDDKEFKSMMQLPNKKGNDDIFIKLGSDKEDKQREASEKVKKAVSINEFLKPAEGERYYSPGGRGRGRGRGSRSTRDAVNYSSAAPSIEDPGQFPTLGGK
ncbi:hypothetical protein Tsubulata_002714 [Turnera subulata]|uniref:Hyaluronan/mRNA-binding protein domain-containing protein n=1 Tax=Turnera subulata TaxID=218843 RepID=A0A9Q0GDE2_9ROSI|nr:hypothetical protein Tsubulata_002714 [Turnera subulata]